MTTSAYNLGNSGLASKLLRIKDLRRAATVARSSLGGVWLGELLGMSQFGLWRFLSQGWMNMGGVWKAVEKRVTTGERSSREGHKSPCRGWLNINANDRYWNLNRALKMWQVALYLLER